MLRISLYFLLVLAFSSSFAWLAGSQADLIILMKGTRITVSLLTAYVLILTVFFCFVTLLSIIRFASLSQFKLRDYVENRKKNLGYRVLTDGLFAAFAGDAQTAKYMAEKSKKLLSSCKEPLLLLLDVQAKILNQDCTSAAYLFETMRKDPQMRLLALTEQFRDATRQKNLGVAYNYAVEAININPNLQWANCALIERFAKEDRWDKAIELCRTYSKIQPQDISRQKESLYKRVVLMTGQAMHLTHKNPQKACQVALKAHTLLPSFIPTTCVAARLLFQLQTIKKGTKFVENIWHANPHPDLGLIYINAGKQHEISDAEKLQRARRLLQINLNCSESQMLVALTALETGELAIAQSFAEELARTFPTENIFLLLAGIETVRSGDTKKISNWLMQVIQAPTDMAWIVDGMELPEWVAVSPITGRLGICEWKRQIKNNRSIVDLGYTFLSNVNSISYS